MGTEELSPFDSQPGSFTVREVVDGYDARARALMQEFERLPFEEVHAPVLDLLPESPGCVLDVGAGSGRDAAWFAKNGHRVIAVEPSAKLRSAAKQLHRSVNIQWLDDQLPALNRVLRSKLAFDVIWLSAVWMHVPAVARAQAFRKLVSLLGPGGSMMVSLRSGPSPVGRPMATVTGAEIENLARRHGLQTVRSEGRSDVGERAGINWEVLWLRLPDDGTGALPLLRHIVLHDHKSSTYKLALLRVLLRIADSAGGFARPGPNDQFIDLPLGLVALFWVRSFLPLIKRGLPQHPAGNRRLAFVKEGFRGLEETESPYNLRIGQQFTGSHANNLIGALRDAAACIRRMPANYIKYPGSSEPVFPCRSGQPVRVRDPICLEEIFLWSFGTFSVPTGLWQSMGRYATWIEPVVVNEWINVMRKYQGSRSTEPDSWDRFLDAIRWLDAEHDTGLVRNVVHTLQERGSTVTCVWTGKPLAERFDIDHCFPFAAWPCNDLWNLLPSSPAVNRRKSDLLPSPGTLEKVKEHIQGWWNEAYLGAGNRLSKRFLDECRGTLPLAVSGNDPHDVFNGLMQQQWVLKRNQGLREWEP